MSASSRIDIAVITVRRDVDYLPQTLASLFMSDAALHELPPVRLFVGSPDAHYVLDLAHHGRLRVEPLSAKEWTAIRDWSVHRRLSYNLWRALATPGDADGGVCVCEDDVIFRDGFVRKLLAAVAEIERRELPKYVLTAYSMYRVGAEPARPAGTYYSVYDPKTHAGNCCLFVSRAAREPLAAFVKQRAVDESTGPADFVVGDFALELRDRGEGRMFQTVVSLVQHVGYVSGGTSGAYLYTPSFEDPWPD